MTLKDATGGRLKIEETGVTTKTEIEHGKYEGVVVSRRPRTSPGSRPPRIWSGAAEVDVESVQVERARVSEGGCRGSAGGRSPRL